MLYVYDQATGTDAAFSYPVSFPFVGLGLMALLWIR